jgi:hypothetical protein
MYRCDVKLNRCDWSWGITWQGSGKGSWVAGGNDRVGLSVTHWEKRPQLSGDKSEVLLR